MEEDIVDWALRERYGITDPPWKGRESCAHDWEVSPRVRTSIPAQYSRSCRICGITQRGYAQGEDIVWTE